MKIKELKQWGYTTLKQQNIVDAHIQAKCLLAFVLSVGEMDLIKQEEVVVAEEFIELYKKGISRIIEGEPLQYIIQKQEFMGLEFYVNKDVLIPQPDTEILVEEVIQLIKKQQTKDCTDILDMCTGSGCIGISLAKYISNSKICVVDISRQALEVTKKNIEKQKEESKIQIIQSDLFENISKNTKFNIIVSNPPYIAKEEIKTLEKSVQLEPMIALDGGEDGLDFYRKIIKQAPNYLKEKGYLCLEIGYQQKKDVIDLLQKEDSYEEIYSKKDLAGLDRIVVAKRK